MSAASFLSALHGLSTPALVLVAVWVGLIALTVVVGLCTTDADRRQVAIKILEVLAFRQAGPQDELPAPDPEPQHVTRGRRRSRRR